MNYIDGKVLRNRILETLAHEVARLPRVPAFCDIIVGDDPASLQYVRMKNNMAKQLGINVMSAQFPITASTEMILEKIAELNSDPLLAGLIVQLPLPSHINKRAVLDAIDPLIDVDATGTLNTELFYKNTPRFIFPTAAAIMALLDECSRPLSGDEVVVVGNGELVGRPVANLLSKYCHVTSIDTATLHPESLLKNADIIISATGRGGLIKGDMIKKNAIIIDAGTSESYGSIVGDVDIQSVLDIAGMLAPVPGGVGPVTVAMLFSNVVQSAKNKFL